MNKIYFEVKDDVVVKYTPIPEIGENIFKNEVVMTKEAFQECYKKWVEPQESDNKRIDATTEAIKVEMDGEDG